MSLKRHCIWDRTSRIICPNGQVFTPEEWVEMYPVAQDTSLHVLCGVGLVNGSFFGIAEMEIEDWERQGVDFSDCPTIEDKLAKIEWIEDHREVEDTHESPADERIASALEILAMQTMETVNDDDPDVD